MRNQHNKHGPPACKAREVVLSCKWATIKANCKLIESVRRLVFGTSGAPPGKGMVRSDFCVYRGRSSIESALISDHIGKSIFDFLWLTPLAAIYTFMPKVCQRIEEESLSFQSQLTARSSQLTAQSYLPGSQ